MDLTVSFQLPRDYVSPVQPMKRRRLTLILKLECQRCEHQSPRSPKNERYVVRNYRLERT